MPNTWTTLLNSDINTTHCKKWYQYNTLPKVLVPKIIQELQQLAFKADSIALFQILPSYQKTNKLENQLLLTTS